MPEAEIKGRTGVDGLFGKRGEYRCGASPEVFVDFKVDETGGLGKC